MARPPHCNARWFENCNYPNCKCIEEKPLTLDDYEKQILKPMIDRFAQCALDEIAIKNELLETALFYGWEPPTRKQKFKWWIEDKKQRVKDIWTILSGGDIHSNCGY